jgi:hypothetical protein
MRGFWNSRAYAPSYCYETTGEHPCSYGCTSVWYRVVAYRVVVMHPTIPDPNNEVF